MLDPFDVLPETHRPVACGIERSSARVPFDRRLLEWKAIAVRHRGGEDADVGRVGVVSGRRSARDPLRQRAVECLTGSERERPRTEERLAALRPGESGPKI